MKNIEYTSPSYWVALVNQTRKYGHCYVHAAARIDDDAMPDASIGGRAVCFSFRGWGRSLQTGGHKYKVHCNFADTGKPVPSKLLSSIA